MGRWFGWLVAISKRLQEITFLLLKGNLIQQAFVDVGVGRIVSLLGKC
jgi:hypothetical protein